MKKLFFFLLLLCPILVTAKSIVQVQDSVTGEILPFATIITKEGKKQTFVTDEHGKVTIPEALRNITLESSFLGYSNKFFKIGEGDTVFIVNLAPTVYTLEDLYVRPKKEKYSKKNNPAVDFVNRLRKDSKEFSPEKEPYYSYDKYEKTLIGVNNFNGKFDKGLMGKQAKFMEQYVDTSPVTGARLLDLLLKEKSSTRIISQEPKANKEIIWGYNAVGIDEMINQQNIKVLLEDIIKDVDVYSPDINLLSNRFVSPLSPLGPDFYKYYLTDTVYVGADECIELTFVPRNAQSMGFNGKIYVMAEDTSMFIKRITMRTPHDINLNYLRNLYINQSFIKDSLNNRHKTFDDLVVEMRILPGTPEIYTRKTSVFDNFSYQKREDLKEHYHKLGSEINLTDSVGNTAQFWDEKRMVPLNPSEYRMQTMKNDWRKVPLFYWGEKVVSLLESGYVGTWKPSKVDLGPINSLVSYSSSQGVRLRLGAMTTAALNPHLFLSGYVAYATKTKLWRYSGTVEYSFTRKKRFANEWPKNGFYASYAYDSELIGERYLFTNAYNIVLSLTRKSNNLWVDRKRANFGYVLELANNLSFEAGVKYSQLFSTADVPFILGTGRQLSNYRQANFNVSIRWAKGEKFVQGRSHRHSVNMDPWIIKLTHEFGPKGLFGAAYTTNVTEISLQKRLWFSAFGYLDLLAKAGKVWDAVYFPALLWPNANLSYTIQPESYSLLDPMEFANDAYAALDMTYFGNGILFNRIPGINKLKLREVVTFKGLMGTLSDRNNPKYNVNILEFPKDAIAMKMKTTPYMEVGVGIDNILTVLRVDYVWRLTYRNNPGVDHSGVRVSLHFNL